MSAHPDTPVADEKKKTRAPKNAGSVYQTKWRGGTHWFASIEVESVDGKRRRITGTGKTAKLALERRNKNYIKYSTTHNDEKIAAKAPTVEKYVDTYLESKKPHLKPESYRKVQRDFENHILPKLGKKKLSSLTPELLEHHFFTTLEGIGKTAQKNVYKNFSALLTHAVLRKQIAENPLATVQRPKAPTVVKFNDEEDINYRVNVYGNLLRKMAKENNPHLPLFTFMLLGMRKAELLGLTWDSVKNLKKYDRPATIVVKQQLKRYEVHEENTGWYLAPYTKGTDEQPKFRVIYLPDDYRQILIKLKKQQDRIPETGAWYDKLIFKNQKNNKWLSYTNLETIWNDTWKEYLKKDYASKRFRIHYVRHICASLLSAQGMSIETIQDVLGHSDAAISLHYRQQMREQRQAATLSLSNWIAGK